MAIAPSISGKNEIARGQSLPENGMVSLTFCQSAATSAKWVMLSRRDGTSCVVKFQSECVSQ